MKYKCFIGGVPSLVTPDEVRELGGNLTERAKKYFGKWYCKEPYCTIMAACYIDNYIAILNFVDEEEERRNMAWEFTMNSMSLYHKTVRPDMLFVDKPEVDSTMIVRINKLLDKFPDGWCGMRYLMNLEWHMKWTVLDFFDKVIVGHDIDHVVGKTFKKNLLVKVNMIDFCEKYYCEKYGISYEELDI